MPHYIALIHKDADSCYGVSFPDVPGVVTAGDMIDEAMRQASEVLEFAAQDWPGAFPRPRTIDELRADPEFQQDASDAAADDLRDHMVALVALRPAAAHAAE